MTIDVNIKVLIIIGSDAAMWTHVNATSYKNLLLDEPTFLRWWEKAISAAFQETTIHETNVWMASSRCLVNYVNIPIIDLIIYL